LIEMAVDQMLRGAGCADTAVYAHLSVSLDRLEEALRFLELWSQDSPSPEALQSSEPFCVDTLSFSQWLQFVFVVRMRKIVKDRMALPGACAIAPMAEESLNYLGPSKAVLLSILVDIDHAVLSRQAM